jgi:hypothetical protein
MKKYSNVWKKIDEYIGQIQTRCSSVKLIHISANDFEVLTESFNEAEKPTIKKAKQIHHRGYVIVPI